MSLKRIVKISTTWCGPCKTYAPIFDKVTEAYKDEISIEKIDADNTNKEEDELIAKFSIRNIPTTLFLDENDELIKKTVGSVSENELKKIIEDEK